MATITLDHDRQESFSSVTFNDPGGDSSAQSCDEFSTDRETKRRYPGSSRPDYDSAAGDTVSKRGFRGSDVESLTCPAAVEGGEDTDGLRGGGGRKGSTAATATGECYGLCWILALLFPLAFVSFAGTRYEWTLHPGSSRRVVISSMLTRSVDVRRLNGDTERGELLVYSVEGRCPLLTGPNITEQFSYEKEIKPGEFAYNRYFLNPGSTIDVTISASAAGARIFLFRSETSFRAWAREPGEYQDNPVAHNYTYIGERPGRISYTSYKADMFYVAYSNPNRETARLTADVRRTLTTFDLEGEDPIPPSLCSPDGSDCRVRLKAWTAVCVVVQAGSNGSPRNGTVGLNRNNIVTVDIRGHRRWSTALVVCAVPIVILEIFARLTEAAQRRGSESTPLIGSTPKRSPPERNGSGDLRTV